ncbi:probable ubiquitin-like-specific protease 2A isoform X2 [Nicotiana tomentosiformis]|uniref:probable ubiquitin-like-specific protease 2A isoform X2 n=1 Tax=Nicotiana tomentosiformis TaxID=4098 RepID=UPI00388C73B7
MTKRNSRKKKTSSSNSQSTSNHKFSIFEFNPEDERVEKHSKKLLQAFKLQKPKKIHSPIDKYTFLGFFEGRTRSSENDSVNEILHIDDSDDIAEKKTLESGATVASSFSSLKPSTDYSLGHLESKCDTSGAKSHLTRAKIPGCSVTDGKSFRGRLFADNEPVILDSDDATEIESSKPACYLPENKGSGNQQELMQSPNLCDKKISVIVKPDRVEYGDTCSTSSILTFSCSSIKLEGSSKWMNLPFTYEWTHCDILTINSMWYKIVKTALVELHLKSNENSGAVVLKFALFHPDWSETQEAIKMLDVRYKDKWNDITSLDCTRSYSPFFGQKSNSVSKHYHPKDNFEEVIYPEGDPDAVSISKRDVDLLQPKNFINDTIIDFYIMYLRNKINPEEKDRFHFFNSFFFRKLADLDKDPTRACEGRAAFQRVRRWTTKVNFFGKDFIFIPVNFSLHWSLIVICHPGEVVTFRGEEEMEKSSRVPCILHMDSIRGSHKGLKNLLQSYLLEEWKERHKEVAEDVARKFSNLPFFSLKLAGDWFSTEDVDCKREHIKRLICEITKIRVQKVSSADCDDNYSLHCLEEENTCMNVPQETCNAREACPGGDLSSHEAELLTMSPVANLIRGLKSAAVSEVVSRDLLQAPDSAKPLTYDNDGQKALLDPFRNVMSPIEEEAIGEQMSISPAIKAGSQPIELFAAPHASSSSKAETMFPGRASPLSKKITPGSQSYGCRSPNSLDDEELKAEVEEVSAPDADSPISTEELAGYIVLDSQEEDENHDPNGLENNLPTTATISASCHKEVNSTDIYDYKVNEKILSLELVEQAAKKPRPVPEVLEVSSSGTGNDETVPSSTSCEEVASLYIQDSEVVNSANCSEIDNLGPATGSRIKHVAGQMRYLFRRRRRGG